MTPNVKTDQTEAIVQENLSRIRLIAVDGSLLTDSQPRQRSNRDNEKEFDWNLKCRVATSVVARWHMRDVVITDLRPGS